MELEQFHFNSNLEGLTITIERVFFNNNDDEADNGVARTLTH